MRHDPMDRLIRALAAKLGAERETCVASAHGGGEASLLRDRGHFIWP